MATDTCRNLIAVGLQFFESTVFSFRYTAAQTMIFGLPYLRGLEEIFFQQDTSRPHTSRRVLTYLDTEGGQLLSRLARSPFLSPIENMWTWVAERLKRPRSPATNIGEVLHIIEASSTNSTRFLTCFLSSGSGRFVVTVTNVDGVLRVRVLVSADPTGTLNLSRLSVFPLICSIGDKYGDRAGQGRVVTVRRQSCDTLTVKVRIETFTTESTNANTIVITAEIESGFVTKVDLVPYRYSPVSSCVTPLQTEVSMGGRQGQHT
ncbi:hypothetical protein TNCV_4749601 [Trichonephila clavipes]|nr:hypothetical protein TNCV_4749601 [Trichonephila clavipes]